MCKSVPQIEAVFTRTSTSAGPIDGTATVSIANPFAACTFRSAFIVVAILVWFPVVPQSTRTPYPSVKSFRTIFDASTRRYRLSVCSFLRVVVSLVHLLHHTDLL